MLRKLILSKNLEILDKAYELALNRSIKKNSLKLIIIDTDIIENKKLHHDQLNLNKYKLSIIFLTFNCGKLFVGGTKKQPSFDSFNIYICTIQTRNSAHSV